MVLIKRRAIIFHSEKQPQLGQSFKTISRIDIPSNRHEHSVNTLVYALISTPEVPSEQHQPPSNHDRDHFG